MISQAQKNQAYLQWYFEQHGPQMSLAELEIRPEDIMELPKKPVLVNPWVSWPGGRSAQRLIQR